METNAKAQLDLFLDRRANGGCDDANRHSEAPAKVPEIQNPYLAARIANQRINEARIAALSAARCRPAAEESGSRAETPTGTAPAVSDDTREEDGDAGMSAREARGWGRPPGLTTVPRGIGWAVVWGWARHRQPSAVIVFVCASHRGAVTCDDADRDEREDEEPDHGCTGSFGSGCQWVG